MFGGFWGGVQPLPFNKSYQMRFFFLRYLKINLWSLELFVSMGEELGLACRVWGKGQSEGGKTKRKKMGPQQYCLSHEPSTFHWIFWLHGLVYFFVISTKLNEIICGWQHCITWIFSTLPKKKKKIAIVPQLLFTFSHLKVSKTLRNQVFLSVRFVLLINS